MDNSSEPQTPNRNSRRLAERHDGAHQFLGTSPLMGGLDGKKRILSRRTIGRRREKGTPLAKWIHALETDAASFHCETNLP